MSLFQIQEKPCYKCGAKPSHPPPRCLATSATCSTCKKKGHYAKVCKSSKLVQRVDENSDEDDISLMTIEDVSTITSKSNKKWQTNLLIGNTKVNFKIDTGADVTVIPEDVFGQNSLGQLRATSKKLFRGDQTGLYVVGTISEKLSLGETCVTEDIYVVKGLKESLLGGPAIEKLNLVARINNIQSQCFEDHIKEKYPQLFHELGEIGEYEVQLKPDAQPFAITSPRRIPLPMNNKVKAELSCMEKLGVIRKVEQPTEWCAGIIAVPKPNGKVCLDLTKLNKSACQETCPLPKIDSLLGVIGDSTVFPKLDANSGFSQERLAEPSQHLTTFLTPFGRYCFQRLPFGLKLMPEHFQKRMLKELEGLEGVICIWTIS